MSNWSTGLPLLGRRQSSEPFSSTLSAQISSGGRPGDNSELQRRGSQSSRHSNVIAPSPILDNEADHSSHPSSRSASKASSLLPTPKILSRRNSAKDGTRAFGSFGRKRSIRDKGRGKELEADDFGSPGLAEHTPGIREGMRSPFSESGSSVIETPYLKTERDPETGKKMINQYLLLNELGRGTHGTVRLCRDISTELPTTEDAELGLGLSGSSAELYAVKIVDRVSKRQRLQQLGANRYMGGRMMRGDDIRKEIAIFKKLNHPNVVKMVEIIDDPESSKIFMVMEYCEGGEVRWRGGLGEPNLSVAESRKIFRETLLGLEYLHHQGVIHRDIKPSNLLYGRDRAIKITDFGCSHYSEALQAASASPGHHADSYVPDIELAKTAGTPAFYAPEMCFSGEEDIPQSSSSPLDSPAQEIPELIVRPPSIATLATTPASSSNVRSSDGLHAAVRRVTPDEDPTQQPFLAPTRSSEAITLRNRNVPPITNAIDVWALGITLYCLLFGTTPYEAVPEYVLMQIIPTTEIEIPPYMGSERMPTGGRSGGMGESQEARDCIDLLYRLLQKDVAKRSTLEQAKHHAFTLHGLPDPPSWLASTDPHARTFVTVSNAEVRAVVIKSSSFRDRFKRGIKTISHKLQLLSTAGRTRSRSIGDTESGYPSSAAGTPGAIPNRIAPIGIPSSPHETGTNLKGYRSREPSPMNSPDPSSSSGRRPSLRTGKAQEPLASPRRAVAPSSPTGLGSSRWDPSTSPSGDRKASSYAAMEARPPPQRRLSTQFTGRGGHVASPITIDLADDQVPGPRPVISTSSLDKLSLAEHPRNVMGESLRQPSSVVGPGRERSSSNSSNHPAGFGVKIARLLSQRSRQSRRSNGASIVSEVEIVPRPRLNSIDRRSSLDGQARSSLDSNPLESGSYSSRGGGSLRELTRSSTDAAESLPPQQPVRRGSNLGGEPYTAKQPYTAKDVEPNDWDETWSDSSDEADPAHAPSIPGSSSFTSNRLPQNSLEAIDLYALPAAVSTLPSLDPIADASPTGSTSTNSYRQPSPISPHFTSELSSRASSRVSSRPSGIQGPARGVERTKSPLGRSNALQAVARLEKEARAGNEEDDGLAITTSTRKSRTASSTSRPEQAVYITPAPP